MRRARYMSLLGAALLIAGPMAFTADAASAGYGQRGEEMGMADLKVDWLCGQGVSSNKVVISGPIKMRGIGVSVRFDATGNRDTRDGVISYADDADGIDLDITGSVERAKSPNAGGAGGNPWVFFQARNAAGTANVGDPILLGRCKGNSAGSARAQVAMQAGIASLLSLGGAGCSNKGTSVGMNRSHNRGVKGQILLSNRLDLAGHVSNPEEVTVNDVIFAGVGAVTKQGGVNGVGGNPKLSVLLWKTKKGSNGAADDNGRPNGNLDGSFTYQTGGTAEIFSTVSDLAGSAKGWRFMGACTDLK